MVSLVIKVQSVSGLERVAIFTILPTRTFHQMLVDYILSDNCPFRKNTIVNNILKGLLHLEGELHLMMMIRLGLAGTDE